MNGIHEVTGSIPVWSTNFAHAGTVRDLWLASRHSGRHATRDWQARRTAELLHLCGAAAGSWDSMRNWTAIAAIASVDRRISFR